MPLRAGQTKSIAAGSGLVLLNVLLIWLLSYTFVPSLVASLFSTLIIGVLVIGGLLTAGTYLSEKGVREENYGLAWVGVGLLQLGYGAFGALAVSLVSPGSRVIVLGITAVITTAIAAVAAAYVYSSDKDFSGWRRYSSYAFIGVLVLALIGSFSPIFALLGFILALAGFLMYLVYEIWEVKTSPRKVWLNAIGIYSAFMGVFVHILRIVVEMYARR